MFSRAGSGCWFYCQLLFLVVVMGVYFSPSLAGESNHFYFQMGNFSPDDLTGGGRLIEFERGENYGLGWGGEVGALRVEYRLALNRASLAGYHDSLGPQAARGDLQSYLLSLNIFEQRKLPGVASRMAVFGFVGLGAVRTELEINRRGGPRLFKDSDHSLIYRGGGGVQFFLSENSNLALQAVVELTRGMRFEDSQTGDEISFGDFETRSVQIEYRYSY